eukprot:CAMPEP_0171289908 /NCGR_PEP_ID=MMETSP0790-20130122/70851_1 /TAXON_ID=2925 /ORGANISM="Alexandrium catenella, Strain OF101" /LENGTH=45 /DNA_ID= /DNA_START= /DNA_END= /DNA_ORIENTATION=
MKAGREEDPTTWPRETGEASRPPARLARRGVPVEGRRWRGRPAHV